MLKLAKHTSATILPRRTLRTSAWTTLKSAALAAAVVSTTLIPSMASALTLKPSSPPFSLGSASAYFVKDVAYGPHTRNKLDIFVPKANYSSKAKTPLVIFIHGGGFSSGSKEKAYTSSNQKMIIELLKHGVAFASINYPLLDKNDTEGLIKSLRGAQRSVQFVKRYQSNFNINPQKVITMGSSAGASTALWLAFHDDMANLNSSDPVEQQSTRVLAALAGETQSSLDVVRWEEVFKQYNFQVSSMGSNATKFYGVSRLQDLYTPRIVAYRQDVDLLRLMDGSDPEVWVANQAVPVTSPTNVSILYHHPYHAKALLDQAKRVGLKGSFYIPKMNIMPSKQETMTQFILRKVQ
nr:alpha/beta hydrolase [uncultured Pseudomonas sp.]